MNIGDTLISFNLIDQNENSISDQSFKGKWTVLYFYPKDMTPGCTTESCEFRDYNVEFKKLNAEVYGISKDNLNSHKKFTEKHQLNFPLIVDTEGVLTEGMGVWQKKSMYGKEYMGIVRSTFILDETNKIVKKYDKVRVKNHVETVLNDLKDLQSS
jgi:thioredoxin-dependent peroxiredoxin